MRSYTTAKAFVRSILDNAGMDDVAIYPGPDLPDVSTRYVVLTRYGGPGVDADGAMDNIAWQARVVGRSLSYESAEEVADAIDIAFLSHPSSQIEGVWVSNISRVGGAPNPLLTDDADRTHFVCSYIAGTELALAN